ncbi:MAG: hypothetical protein ACKOE3_03020, partial [Betaproteobacteria bacterium]
QALQAQCRSAEVSWAHAEALEGVSRVLARLLRQVPGLRLEMLQAFSSEMLLARFNEHVAALPLQQARLEGDQQQGLTVWMVRVTSRLEWHEVNLLLSMVQSFPGTGVRLLLLCANDTVSDQVRALRSRWGTSLHHWDVSNAHRVSREAADHARLAKVAQPERPSLVAKQNQDAAARQALLGTGWVRALLRYSTAGRRAALRWMPRLPLVTRVLRMLHLQPRWKWGVGGLMMSLGATAAAWWQARPDAGLSPNHPLRRPVPEIVELLEDVRTPSAQQENRS